MAGFPKTCIVCGRRGVAGTSRCEKHPAPVQTEAERLARAPYRRGYSDPEYLRNRQICHQEATGRCAACGEPLGSDWQCDHIVPLRDCGSNLLENLQCLCGRCTKAKTRADRQRRRVRREQT
jgi:5-methylcytosine-specific restriction endonuclease McrA